MGRSHRNPPEYKFLKSQSSLKLSKSKTIECKPPDRWKAKNIYKPFVVAIARDKAFQFCYQDTLDLFKHHGGKVVYFSPMKDKDLPPEADWLYFPGGYPELHAKALSRNKSMLKSIKKWNQSGKLLVAECGGMMYMGKKLIDAQGTPHPMVGVYNFSTSIKQKKLTLGYRQLKSINTSGTPIFLKGHEFHYSCMEGNRENALWHEKIPGKPLKIRDGFRNLNSFAFYTHIYWGSNQPWLKYLLKIVEQQKREEK